MTTLLRTLTATLIITILSAIPTFAQSSLDKIIEPLKDGDKGSSVVYREKRNPTTKAIIESALLVEFNDSKLANKIIETMKRSVRTLPISRHTTTETTRIIKLSITAKTVTARNTAFFLNATNGL